MSGGRQGDGTRAYRGGTGDEKTMEEKEGCSCRKGIVGFLCTNSPRCSSSARSKGWKLSSVHPLNRYYDHV